MLPVRFTFDRKQILFLFFIRASAHAAVWGFWLIRTHRLRSEQKCVSLVRNVEMLPFADAEK